jgi:hypothetical protein
MKKSNLVVTKLGHAIAQAVSRRIDTTITPLRSQLNARAFCAVKYGVDSLCGLVVRVLGCRSGGPGSIPGTTRKKSSGSGTGSTQTREHN